MGNIAALGNTVVQTTPVGVIEAFAGVNAPAGWLFCDGSAVSRIQYPELFSALGTTYGSGDGSTTFNLPDLRGRMPFGKGTHADVASLGQNEGASLANRRPKHQHTTYDPGHNHGISDPGHTHQVPQNRGPDSLSGGNTGNYDVATYGVGLYYTTLSSTTGVSVNNANTNFKVNPEGASSSTSPADAPPYLVVNYIIKAVADLPRGGWFYQNQPPVVTQLPANPQIGEEVYYYLTSPYAGYQRQRWNGTTWDILSDSKGNSSWQTYNPIFKQGASTISSTISYARYMVMGKTCFVRTRIVASGAGSAPNIISTTVPIAPLNGGYVNGTFVFSDVNPGVVYAALSPNVGTDLVVFGYGFQRGNGFGADPSLAVASGDVIEIALSYEVA